jgi:hypothetical protein
MVENVGVTSPTIEVSTPRRAVDQVCAAAIELAREAAVEAAGGPVGAHLEVVAEGERVATHAFAANEPGYGGWHWAVTVARVARSKVATICEIALLPGDGAVLAPDWVPWDQRLRPGDLGVGDVLPTDPDDDRLEPAYAGSDDPSLDDIAFELGVGRARVMSRLGRSETAERWYDGDQGPSAPMAKQAPASCGTCGFYLPLSGSLRLLFGACGNLFAPDDGRVVSADHGCGAHSEALVLTPLLDENAAVRSAVTLDDDDLEVVATAHTPGSVDDSGDEAGEAAEPFGHG